MKSFLKSWAATNAMEFSTWIGMVMLVRELIARYPSTIMVCLSLVLVFVSDAKINGFIQAKAPGLKKWIESL